MRMSRYLRIWVSFFLCLGVAGAQGGKKPLVEDAMVSDVEGGAKVDELRSFGEGEKLYLDFRIGNFTTSGDPVRMKVEYLVSPLDDLGRHLAPGLKGEVDEEITALDTLWRPHLRYELEIPQVPRPTPHRFVIQLKDVLSGVENTTEVPFNVYSKFPVAPPTLTVYDLQFFGGEFDEAPLKEGRNYRRGEKVFLRFSLTGFQHSEKQGYRLEYGVTVRDAGGRVLLSVPQAAAESRESFYPKAYVPCAVAILLDRNARPGKYSLVLSVRDTLGNQRLESPHAFVVD